MITESSNGRRPASKKPHRDFPLFKHATGRWAKKVRGKLHYFGSVKHDPTGEAAANLWLDQKDDLLAGREPREHSEGWTVVDLCNYFLESKEKRVESGELAPRSFKRYKATCEMVAKRLGGRRVVEDLRPHDFEELRAWMAKQWKPVALANEIQMVRSLFKHAYDAELVDKPVRIGVGFRKPSAKTLRLERAKSGEKLFTPEEIRAVFDHATVNMKAMVLLGINGGLGNTDVALLGRKTADLDSGWLTCPRAKTGIVRRIPLWPETVDAIRQSLSERRQPNKPESKHLLFIGRRGEDYVGGNKGHRVHAEMRRAIEAAGVNGRTFYDLRRTFQTIGEEAGDLVAVKSIMGHIPPASDMSAVYRQPISDQRLRAVTDHVRRWLFSGDMARRLSHLPI
jgi:integrase